MRWLAIVTRNYLGRRNDALADRLLKSRAVLDAADVLASPLGTAREVRFEAIANALASARISETFEVIASDAGQTVKLRRTLDGVKLDDGCTDGILVPHLGLLDPSKEIRLAQLEKVLQAALPAIPNEPTWRAKAAAAPLTPYDFRDFIEAVNSAPSAKIERLHRAFSEHAASTNLYAQDIGYYEGLIGRIPTSETAPEYLEAVFYPHVRQVFQREARWGWMIAVAGYTGPSVDLNRPLSGVDDATLLEVLAEPDFGSPLENVALLSVALNRAGLDARFLELAKGAVARLVKNIGAESEVSASTTVFRALAMLTLRALSENEETWRAPAYWRRMAALAHAHLTCQVFDFSKIDPKSFEDWANAASLWPGTIATTQDAWTEAAWLPDRDYLFTPWYPALAYAIRLCAGHPLGESLYGESEISEINKTAGLNDFLVIWGGMPDLVEASRLGREGQSHELRTELVNALILLNPTADDAFQVWSTVLSHLRGHRMSNEIRKLLLRWIEGIVELNGAATQLQLQCLINAARIGATQRAIELADAIAIAVNKIAEVCETPQLAAAAWSALTTAAGAYTLTEDGVSWLDSRLIELAFRLPRGAPCFELAARIRGMQQLQAVNERKYARALAIASSASIF